MLKEVTNNVQKQVLITLAELSPSRQELVLNYALTLRQQELTQQWESISEEEAGALKAEFASEDLELAEGILSNYLSRLQEEDRA